MNELLMSILRATAVHTGYTLVCVAIGFALGLTLGVGLSRLPALSKYLIPLLSIFNTVPGIVFIGVLVILIGMTPATVIIALSIYAMFPVLNSTHLRSPTSSDDASIGPVLTFVMVAF